MNDYEEHFDYKDKRKIVIAFAGGPQNRYQFGPTLDRLRMPHVLMRDTTQEYHSLGVKGIGNRAKVVEYIRDLRDAGHYIVTIGVSSGAYAALLYGQLTPADEVIAISPLTGRETDDFDPQWHPFIHDPAMVHLDDLRKYFTNGPIPTVKAFISNYTPTSIIDRQMCTRIGIKDITVIPGFDHGEVGKGMRDRGMFWNLLKN